MKKSDDQKGRSDCAHTKDKTGVANLVPEVHVLFPLFCCIKREDTAKLLLDVEEKLVKIFFKRLHLFLRHQLRVHKKFVHSTIFWPIAQGFKSEF